MLRKVLTAAGALLVVFHGWLLVGHAWDGQLTDAAVLVRWLVAGGLVWGLWGLRRQDAPIFFGRKAVALWLLAALLHGPAVAEQIDPSDIPALPEVVATLTQLTFGAATVVGLILLAGLLSASRRVRMPRARARSTHALLGALAPGTHLAFSPRPPPVA